MGAVDAYPAGAFCWIDLGTTDVPAASTFYGELFGWDLQEVPAPDGGYTMCLLGGRPVAGIHHHDEDAGVAWSSSVRVDDVDVTVGRARDLGVGVLVEPGDIPGAGRAAALTDPAGAVLGLWQPAGHPGAGLVNELGTWSWNELVARDLEPAAAFYGDLFGWAAEPVPAPMHRLSFTMGDLLIGGAHAPTPGEHGDPRWDVSFRVENVEGTTGRVEDLGGRVLIPPMDVPIGRFAIATDPTGAAFTVAEFEAPFRGVDRPQGASS
jgi:predicted enzyme related to lactoylglutathione lyase